MHFTPTGASWINLVERFFALLTEKQIRRSIHRRFANGDSFTVEDRYTIPYQHDLNRFIPPLKRDVTLCRVGVGKLTTPNEYGQMTTVLTRTSLAGSNTGGIRETLHRYPDDGSLHRRDRRGAGEGDLGGANRTHGTARRDRQCRPLAVFGCGWLRRWGTRRRTLANSRSACAPERSSAIASSR